MKKTLLSLAFATSTLFASAQIKPGLSDVAVYDDFATVDPYSVETTELSFEDVTKPAYKGIYWWTDDVTDPTDLDYSWTRGTGSLIMKVDKPYANYKPVGVGFGNYAASASATSATPFSLDLSSNATLEITLKAAVDTANIDVLFQLKDADGTILYVDKGALTMAETEPYKYQVGLADNNNGSYVGGLGKLLADNNPVTFTYDFKNALPGAYPNFEKDNSTFDFEHVTELSIFFTNSKQDASYKPLPLHANIEITNFKLGDVATITGLEDNFLTENRNEVVSVYDMMGKLVATGKLKELGLESGKLYVVKSGNKSRKIVMN